MYLGIEYFKISPKAEYRSHPGGSSSASRTGEGTAGPGGGGLGSAAALPLCKGNAYLVLFPRFHAPSV